MKVNSGWIYKHHWIRVHKPKKICLLIFSTFFLYLFYYHFDCLNLLLFFSNLWYCFFEPSLFLIIRNVLMIEISLFLIIPFRKFWSLWLRIFILIIFFEIVLIATFYYFMKLLFEFGRNLLNIFNERRSKHSGYLVESAFSILESKYGHSIVPISAIDTKLPIFVASVLYFFKRIIDILPEFKLLLLFGLAELASDHGFANGRQLTSLR